MKKEIISVKHVSVEFDGVTILKDHTFSVCEKEFIGIIGPNGGGKTTLLKVMLGLIEPKAGRVTVFDKSPQEACDMIGYVPQAVSFDRDFPISVWDAVLMGRLSKRRLFYQYNAEDHAVAEKALAKVEILHLKKRKIGELSGGERQRVFVARALASEPKILFLDEPTASIDPQMKTGIYDLLGELKKQMTIILVTHDIGVISSHVDKVACLNRQLFFHDSAEITKESLEAVYHCPVDLIAHGVPHRVFHKH
jgi:zinc transport system ATP-binding protein